MLIYQCNVISATTSLKIQLKRQESLKSPQKLKFRLYMDRKCVPRESWSIFKSSKWGPRRDQLLDFSGIHVFAFSHFLDIFLQSDLVKFNVLCFVLRRE